MVRIPDQTSPDRIVAMFTVDGLDEVRTVVGVAGTRAGVDPLVLGSLVVAVNEIATNAVRYAGGNGVLHVLIDPHGLYVEISDNGPGLRGDPDIRLPSPEAAGGRGLWLAARLCPNLTLNNTPYGLTVQIFTPTAPAPPA